MFEKKQDESSDYLSNCTKSCLYNELQEQESVNVSEEIKYGSKNMNQDHYLSHKWLNKESVHA